MSYPPFGDASSSAGAPGQGGLPGAPGGWGQPVTPGQPGQPGPTGAANPWAQPAPGGGSAPWGSGTPGADGVPEVEILPGYVPERRRRRAGLVAAVSAVAVAAVAGGGVYAWSALSSPGDQPERHLPASTAVMVKVDLNPPATQKVQALRFAAKLPATSGSADDGDGDLRRAVYDALSKESGTDLPAWSEVSPWLGDRAAVAMVEGAAGKAVPVVLLQVTDQQRATRTLRGLHLSGGSGAVVGDGWAYVSNTEALAADVLAEARKKSLDTDPTFTADLARAGGDGIAAAWFDGTRVTRIGRAVTGQGARSTGAASGIAGLSNLDGSHGALQLRFSGADLELVGAVQGKAPVTVPRAGAGVEQLPADSVVALGANDVGKLAVSQWDAVQQQLGMTEGATGEGPIAEDQIPGGGQPPAGARVGKTLSTKQIAARLKAAGISAKTAQTLAAKIKAAESKGGMPAELVLGLVDDMHAEGLPAKTIVTEVNAFIAGPALGGGAGSGPSGGSVPSGLGDLKLPGDLEALLGTSFRLAVGPQGAQGEPTIGVRVASTSPRVGPATTAISKLLAAEGIQVQRRNVPGGYVLANTAGQADALARGGSLGQSEQFRRAVPDAASASVVVFADLSRLPKLLGEDLSAEDAKTLSAFGAVGIGVSYDGKGLVSVRARLTTR